VGNVWSDRWVEWANVRGACTAPPYMAVLSLSLMRFPADIGSSVLVVVLESMRLLQAPGSMEDDSGRGSQRAAQHGACPTSPYGVVRVVFPHFPVVVETVLRSLRIWGYESLGGFSNGCLEFCGMEISLGGWRMAVSRMAAPRGPVFGHH